MDNKKIVKAWIEGTKLGDALLGDSINFNDKVEEKETAKLTANEKKLKKMQKYEEHYEQVKVISKWNKLQAKGAIPDHWQLFRNANTQFLSIGSIAWSQQEGLVSGVPDLTCIIDNKVLFIEMKRESKRPKTNRGFRRGLNDAQLERFPKFEKCGFKPIICYSSLEVFSELEKFTGCSFIGDNL